MAWMKHNPAFLDPAHRVQQFVIRTDELETLVRTLRENDGAANQHVLVLAPRGRGKTMLVHRLVDEIRQDPTLAAAWTPIVFGEESYQISTRGEFWLEALLHIADATRAPRWEQIHEALSEEMDERRLADSALARVLDYADEVGTRLLLVVENFDTLVDTQLSEADEWSLRKTLQTEPRLMLLATAVTRFEGVEREERAMFEMFQRIELDPLTASECQTLWSTICQHPVPFERAAALRVLTGGNPRLMVLLTQFASGNSLHTLLSDLASLIDEHTDYFKHNIEALSPKVRRVFLALADLWTPAKAADVAHAARLQVNETSTMLNRLVAEGRVEIVGQEGRAKIYQVSERLYNIYHLLRRRSGNAPRVRAFVEFIQQFYEPAYVSDVVSRVGREALEGGFDRGPHLELMRQLVRGSDDAATMARRLAAIPRELYDQPDFPVDLGDAAGQAEVLQWLAADDPGRWAYQANHHVEDALNALFAGEPLSAETLAVAQTTAHLVPFAWLAVCVAQDWSTLARIQPPPDATCMEVCAAAVIRHADPVVASAMLRNAEQVPGIYPELRLARAHLHLRRGDLASAAELLEGFEDDALGPELSRHLIEALENLGQVSEAQSVAHRARARLPDRSSERYDDFVVHGEGREEAMAAERDWLTHHPDDVDAHLRLALATTTIDLAKAIALAEAVAGNHPEHARAHRLVGLLYRHQGRFEEAATAFRTARDLDPRNPGWELEAKCYLPDDLSAVRTLLAHIQQHGHRTSLASLIEVLLDATPAVLTGLIGSIEDLVPTPDFSERAALARLQLAVGAFDRAATTLKPLFTEAALDVDPLRANADLMRFAAAGQPALGLSLVDERPLTRIEPTVIALRQLAGHTVIAAPEILEVAAHVRNRIEHLRRTGTFWRTDPNTLPITDPTDPD